MQGGRCVTCLKISYHVTKHYEQREQEHLNRPKLLSGNFVHLKNQEYRLDALMSDYISSLLIEPIFRHARRLSPHLSPVSAGSVPAAPGNHELDHSAQPDFPHTSPQKLDNHDAPPVTLPAYLETDLDCTRRRLVACRPNTSDHRRLGTMDDSQGSGDDDTRIPQSHQAASTHERGNFEDEPTSALTTASSDAIIDRYDSSHLRELPEDDGMTVLRKKIHAIRDNDDSGIQKARLIHSLMIESYQATRRTFSDRPISSQSPSSARSREHSPTSSSSPRGRRATGRLSLDFTEQRPATPVRIRYNLAPEDLEPTFAPKDVDIPAATSIESPTAGSVPPTETDDRLSNGDYSEEDTLVLGCQHYKRNVKLQCYTCKKWYTCRFCHDQTEDHALERRKTENMLCMLCKLPQPAAEWCTGCGEQAASYFCAVCKLWDNDSSKSIYHCHDCGICRIGQGIGKDFYHCKV